VLAVPLTCLFFNESVYLVFNSFNNKQNIARQALCWHLLFYLATCL